MLWHTPLEIEELQQFGWGDFTDKQLADKCNELSSIMSCRPKITGTPRMSVVVAAHKEEAYLLGTLRSLAQQTHSNIEIIIVSNGEPYGNKTQQIAEQAGFRVVHEPHKGWAVAHQVGLESSAGTIIASTDADTLHFPRWLEAADNVFEQTGCIAAKGRVHFLELQLRHKLYRAVAELYKEIFEYDRPQVTVRGVPGANSFYLREAALKVGGFSDMYDLSWPDTAIFCKMLPHGGEAMIDNPMGTAFTSGRTLLSKSIVGMIALSFYIRIFGILPYTADCDKIRSS